MKPIRKIPINISGPQFDAERIILTAKNPEYLPLLKHHDYSQLPMAVGKLIREGNEYLIKLESDTGGFVNAQDQYLLDDCPRVEIGGRVLGREGNMITHFELYEV